MVGARSRALCWIRPEQKLALGRTDAKPRTEKCMTPRSSFIVIVLAFVSLRCSAPNRSDVTGTRTQLDSLLALHAAHFIAKDINAIANAYTEDAVVRSNHMQPLRGRAAIRDFVTTLLATVDIRTLKYTTEKIAVYGDSAWQIMTYELSAQSRGGPLQSDRGSAIDLWVRDTAGIWRIQDNVINSSVPLPAAAQPR
jgi:ketosteroid isomerase-like protein